MRSRAPAWTGRTIQGVAGVPENRISKKTMRPRVGRGVETGPRKDQEAPKPSSGRTGWREKTIGRTGAGPRRGAGETIRPPGTGGANGKTRKGGGKTRKRSASWSEPLFRGGRRGRLERRGLAGIGREDPEAHDRVAAEYQKRRDDGSPVLAARIGPSEDDEAEDDRRDARRDDAFPPPREPAIVRDLGRLGRLRPSVLLRHAMRAL